MKRSLNILKSYFKTGDKPTQVQYEDVFDSLTHRDEFEATANTVFVSAANGNDVTAKIGDSRKPYLTIDAAVAAFEAENPREGDLTNLDHPFFNIKLISEGTYKINVPLPNRNIYFKSDKVCTVDFSDNTNQFLNILEANVYHKYKFSLPKGKLFNNTENRIQGDFLFFEGEFDTIEIYGAPYSTSGRGFINPKQTNVSYNLLKGSGIAFSTLGSNDVNTFKGNIESVGGKLVVNNKARGINHFDFDEATGTHELGLLKGSLVYEAHVNFGKHKPNVVSNVMQIAHSGKIYVNFKKGAETYGKFYAGEVHFSGKKVTINSSLARLQYKLFFEDIFVKTTGALCSLIGNNAQVNIKNSYIEVPAGLVAIETNTGFSTDSLVFTGQNTVYQTGTPGSNLVTKYATANPTNFSSKVELQNSLITNGVLNTTITGNTDSIATVTIGNTNTY